MTEPRDIELAPGGEHAGSSSGRSVIAAIGIDHYRGWRRLTNAVSDAQGVLALFERLGFERLATPLLDDAATGKAIQELVMDDLRELGPEDSLVLFYAGHGATRTDRPGGEEVKTGYLIPVDATDRAATWIELDGWLRAVAKLPAKHILVILDACHSGIALGAIIKWRDIGTWRDTPLPALKARRSRRIITSALDDQKALDSGPVHGHSLFTGCLIAGLTHGLAGSGHRVTTGSELGLYVQNRVQTYPGSRQTPDFGTFDFDDRGELTIPLLSERSEAPAESVPTGRRVWAVTGGLVGLALATGGFVVFHDGDETRTTPIAMAPPAVSSTAPSPGTAAPPADDTGARARKAYEEGMKLFDVHRIDGAIAQLENAYQLDPKPEYLLSLARARDERGDVDEALFLYRRYLETTPAGATRDLILKLEELENKRAVAAAAKPPRTGAKTPPPAQQPGRGTAAGSATTATQPAAESPKPQDLTKELMQEGSNR
jgi:hypothetical protein